MPSLRLQRLPHLSTLLSFVLIFGLIGTAWLLHSHASTPAVAVQPESGSVASPATVVNDPTAGGGKAVRFEKAVIASHGTACGWTTKAPAYKHVIWIWEENKDASKVDGVAPYLDTVSKQCASLTNVQDSATTVALPSEPQYAAGTSGSNCNSGITSNSGSGTGCITNDNAGNQLNTVSIFQLVSKAGGTWGAYQEGMPSNCDQANGGTKYAFRHNPPAFYTQIRSACNSVDIPISVVTCPTTSNQTCGTPSNRFTQDIARDSLPTFTFLTPNLNNDMHDGTVLQGDNWLHTYLPLIVSGPNYQAGDTAIFIMWDEGSSNSTGGQLIPTTIIAPSIATGTVNNTAVNNIGLLKTTEDMLGLTPYLGCASGTPPGGIGKCNPYSDVSLMNQLNL